MKKGGISILGMLFLFIILMFVLSYFNVSLKTAVEKPAVQDNAKYVEGTGKSLWDEYLKKPVDYLWNAVWVKIFWASFVSNMEDIRDHKSNDIQKIGPTVNFKY